MASLTEQQTLFVEFYVQGGGDGKSAAIHAGYGTKNPHSISWQMLQKPHIQEAIRQAQMRLLGGKLGSKALQVLGDLMTDPDVPANVRLEAAKVALDRSNLRLDVAQQGRLLEMPTGKALEDFISVGKLRLAQLDAMKADLDIEASR